LLILLKTQKKFAFFVFEKREKTGKNGKKKTFFLSKHDGLVSGSSFARKMGVIHESSGGLWASFVFALFFLWVALYWFIYLFILQKSFFSPPSLPISKFLQKSKKYWSLYSALNPVPDPFFAFCFS
jgi:hypothetical protein